tara:strand:+ start:241 stop:663 length:423 start_codon:yes stop_codon:yes gene_type:complete
MSEWCQNKKCAEKKTKGQIRGNKGSKYYQSNKSTSYYFHWCSMGCRDAWWNEHKDTCMQAVGFIDKQIIHLKDAWYVEYKYDWRLEQQDRYYLRNLLKNVEQQITREQAQSPEDIQAGHDWRTIDDRQAKELAVTLGLAS